MNYKEQKYLFECLISSSDIFARCIGILESEYFDPKLQQLVKYAKEYYEKYNAIPDLENINSKSQDTEFKSKQITTDMIAAVCDEVEQFCKQSALTDAVVKGMAFIEDGEFGKLQDAISKAMLVSLQKDLGVDVYANPREYMHAMLDTEIAHPCGIDEIDEKLGGGLFRKQLTMFSGNSGAGKSVMVTNIGSNYSLSGLNVVYFSLELSEQMVFTRTAAIISGYDIRKWKENIDRIADSLTHYKTDGAGSFTLKRLPYGSTTNDFRSFLKFYELEYGCKPDVIIADYLDIMGPNGGTRNKSVSEQDKEKAEQLVELLHDYNAIGITASQQNRESLKMQTPDQGVIAGGMTKVNTVDNYISIIMDPAMKLEGKMFIHYLKTRSSDAVGKSSVLAYHNHNLRITDADAKLAARMKDLRERRKLMQSYKEEQSAFDAENNFKLPGLEDGDPDTEDKISRLIEEVNSTENTHSSDDKISRLIEEVNSTENTHSSDDTGVETIETPSAPKKTNAKMARVFKERQEPKKSSKEAPDVTNLMSILN